MDFRLLKFLCVIRIAVAQTNKTFSIVELHFFVRRFLILYPQILLPLLQITYLYYTVHVLNVCTMVSHTFHTYCDRFNNLTNKLRCRALMIHYIFHLRLLCPFIYPPYCVAESMLYYQSLFSEKISLSMLLLTRRDMSSISLLSR